MDEWEVEFVETERMATPRQIEYANSIANDLNLSDDIKDHIPQMTFREIGQFFSEYRPLHDAARGRTRTEEETEARLRERGLDRNSDYFSELLRREREMREKAEKITTEFVIP